MTTLGDSTSEEEPKIETATPEDPSENGRKEDIYVEDEDATLNLLEGSALSPTTKKYVNDDTSSLTNSPTPDQTEDGEKEQGRVSPRVKKLKQFVTYLDCGLSNDAICSKRALSNFMPPSPLRIQKEKTTMENQEEEEEENLDPVEYSDLTNDDRDIWIVTTGESNFKGVVGCEILCPLFPFLLSYKMRAFLFMF
jgi:hypothetical protein